MTNYDFTLNWLKLMKECNISVSQAIKWYEISKQFKLDFEDIFHSNQIRSKKWLIESLKLHALSNSNIFIFGSWYGILANLLFLEKSLVNNIFAIDINPEVKDGAHAFNYGLGKYTHVVEDMCKFEYPFRPNIVINTSCEHLTKEQFIEWYNLIPEAVTVVLQTNNYDKIPEHVNCYSDQDSFTDFIRRDLKVGSKNLYYQGTLQCSNFERYMVIFKKPSGIVL